MDTTKSIKNRGVLLGQRDTDYVAGTLPFEERNPSGNWEQYLPPGEWQRNHIVDTMACVSFSALNSIETQLKYFGVEMNLSDRFTATMSGTTKEGNWLFKVADSIRKDGVVLESEHPAPKDYTWDSYYTPPTIDIINKAKDFLNEYKVSYEFIPPKIENLIKHLKHAPIQIIIPGHAILNFFTEDEVIKYFDSYSPFIKQTNTIYSAMKIVLNKKDMNTLTEEQVKQLYHLVFNRDADEGGLLYYTGKTFDFFYEEVMKSEEKVQYRAINEAVKRTELWAYENGKDSV